MWRCVAVVADGGGREWSPSMIQPPSDPLSDDDTADDDAGYGGGFGGTQVWCCSQALTHTQHTHSTHTHTHTRTRTAHAHHTHHTHTPRALCVHSSRSHRLSPSLSADCQAASQPSQQQHQHQSSVAGAAPVSPSPSTSATAVGPASSSAATARQPPSRLQSEGGSRDGEAAAAVAAQQAQIAALAEQMQLLHKEAQEQVRPRLQCGAAACLPPSRARLRTRRCAVYSAADRSRPSPLSSRIAPSSVIVMTAAWLRRRHCSCLPFVSRMRRTWRGSSGRGRSVRSTTSRSGSVPQPLHDPSRPGPQPSLLD
jgi:hypothetical protein